VYLDNVSNNNLFLLGKSKKRNKGHILRWGSHEEGKKVLLHGSQVSILTLSSFLPEAVCLHLVRDKCCSATAFSLSLQGPHRQVHGLLLSRGPHRQVLVLLCALSQGYYVWVHDLWCLATECTLFCA